MNGTGRRPLSDRTARWVLITIGVVVFVVLLIVLNHVL